MTHPRRLGGLGVLLLSAGCADRGLASGPASPPSTGTWIAVGVAATLAALVIAALVLLPQGRVGGARLAATALAVQAGALVVGGAVLVGAAIRSGHLVTRPAGAEQAASLLRLTGLDGGDSGFFRILAGVTLVLGLLLVVVLVLTARFAAGDDPLERLLAMAFLGLEGCAAAASIVLVLLGYRAVPIVVAAVAFPLVLAAAITCWPEASAPPVGYNDSHG